MKYRIRIERIETVLDIAPKWLRGGPNAKSPDHSEYERLPEGAPIPTKEVTTQVFDQTVDYLDVSATVVWINTEGQIRTVIVQGEPGPVVIPGL